jgi:hypothetical protein
VATAYIREYADIAITYSKYIQAPAEPAIADQTITTSATHAESNAFDPNTRFIAISTSAAQAHCCAFGTAPVATTSNLRLPANSMFFFGVRKGDKVSLIDVT